jgi:transcriptional regulator with XRE-family HTH domain
MSDLTNVQSSLPERLRAAREHAGLSQGQVARMLSYSRPTISEIEAGRRKVSSEELVQFSRIYDVSTSWLIDEKPEVPDPAVELAARELVKLKREDFDSVLHLLRTLRKSEKPEE